MDAVKPAPSKEARKERLAQRSVRMIPKPRKGTKAARKQRAIKESE
jgi:hypothetical protein